MGSTGRSNDFASGPIERAPSVPRKLTKWTWLATRCSPTAAITANFGRFQCVLRPADLLLSRPEDFGQRVDLRE